MFIVYIAFGIASGLVAAAITLFSGASFFMAVLAYVLAGMIGMMAGLVWANMPKQAKPAKQPATQRG